MGSLEVVLRAAVKPSSMKALQACTFYHSIPTIYAVLGKQNIKWLSSTWVMAATLEAQPSA